MTETLTLGSLVLVCEPSSHGFVYVTIPDGGCDDRLMITATQWQSIIALGDKQRAADKEIERLKTLLAEVIEKYEYVDHTFVPKFPANGGTTQSQRRIAEIRTEAGIEPRAPGDGYCQCGERLDKSHHHGEK